MKYLLIFIACFTNLTIAATLPQMDVNGYTKFCEEKWTKKGVVDQNMVDYCVENHVTGYREAQLLTKKYENQNWIQGAIDLAVKKWTKKGTRQDDMVAYTLKEITDGFDELEIASKKSGFNKNKYNACYAKWGVDFSMVWYCYKDS
jgi:hypothetical protein